jgi:hypothetical protein
LIYYFKRYFNKLCCNSLIKVRGAWATVFVFFKRLMAFFYWICFANFFKILSLIWAFIFFESFSLFIYFFPHISFNIEFYLILFLNIMFIISSFYIFLSYNKRFFLILSFFNMRFLIFLSFFYTFCFILCFIC